MAHDVFISYAQADKKIADAICVRLESQGIRCWIAPRDVRPGLAYPAEIMRGIEGCRILTLVFSSEANVSRHVQREVERAVSKGRVILPFRINDVLPSPELEYLISGTHWLDAITPPIEEHIQKLARVAHATLSAHDSASQVAKDRAAPARMSHEECVSAEAKPSAAHREALTIPGGRTTLLSTLLHGPASRRIALAVGFLALCCAIVAATVYQFTASGQPDDPAIASKSQSMTNPRLDASFGTSGVATLDVPGAQETLEKIALQSDEKIVAVGGYHAEDFIVARYNANGSLDQTFGSSGWVTTDFDGHKDYAKAVAIQSDEKIVVAGSTHDGADFALARYNADGTIDGGFGAAGKVRLEFAPNSASAINDLVIQPDGMILAAGQSTPRELGRPNPSKAVFALARFEANGDLDQTFATGGKQRTDFGPSADVVRALALDSTGRILAAGYTGGARGRMAMALARYDAHGNLDSSFGSEGKLTTTIGPLDAAAEDVAVQADGRILLVGNASTHNGYHWAIVRCQTNGDLDPGFGTDGIVTTEFGRAASGAVAVGIQDDERIVAAGLTENNAFGLARYDADGALDQRFGVRGKWISPLRGFPFAQPSCVVIQGNGRIVVGGFARDSAGDRFALVRFLASP
jgi:uncharacterized delta-60 repeat protein